MILLDPAIEIGVIAMLDFYSQNLSDGTRIGIVPVSGHLLPRLFRNGQSTLKELLRGLHITGGTQQRVHQIAVVIDRAVQVTPLAFYFQVGFIDIPTTAHLS